MCPGLPDARRPHQLSYISNPELRKRTSDSGRSLNTGAAVSLCVRWGVRCESQTYVAHSRNKDIKGTQCPTAFRQPRRPSPGSGTGWLWVSSLRTLLPTASMPPIPGPPPLWVARLCHNHMKKPFPRGVPTPGKAGREPSAAPPRGWNTGRDQCGRQGVATLFQSGPGAFRRGPCPAPTLVLSGAAGDPQEPQPPGSGHR